MKKISISSVRAELASVRKRCFHKKERIALTKNNLTVAYLCPYKDRESLIQSQTLSSATYSCHEFREKLTFILDEMEAGKLDIAEVSYHRTIQFLMIPSRVYIRFLKVKK